MRGGAFHEMMLDQLDAAFQSKGLRTRRQVLAQAGGRITGYIDLVVWGTNSEQVLLVEVEMTKKRAMNDVQKRRDMGLGEKAILWIVVPTGGLSRSIERLLSFPEIDAAEPVFVLTMFEALRQIEHKNPFCSRVIEEQKGTKLNSKIP